MANTVSGNTLLHDATLVVRDIIASGTTDPLSGSRATGNAFVMTAYPTRTGTQYPLVTVQGNRRTVQTYPQAQNQAVELEFEVRVWGRNVKERDQLADDVFDALRTSQTTTSGTNSFGIYSPELLSEINVDEEGSQGLHAKVQQWKYFAVV